MLREYLKKIPDHRRGQGQRYKLHDILFVSILAILSGADSYRDIVRFSKGHLKKLKNLFCLSWKRAPSKSILSDIFCGINSLFLENIFRDYSHDLSKNDKEISESIKGFAIDGKALRGSFDHLKENKILYLLSVFCTNNELILGHVEIPEKTNEIPTAQALVKELGLPEGSIYTLDAMHCQKKHLRQLRRQKES
jgi:hypothetical protein